MSLELVETVRGEAKTTENDQIRPQESVHMNDRRQQGPKGCERYHAQWKWKVHEANIVSR